MSFFILFKTFSLLILSIHFIRFVILPYSHLKIPYSTLLSVSKVYISHPNNKPLHTQHFTSIFFVTISVLRQNTFFFSLMSSLATPILVPTSILLLQFVVYTVLKYICLSTCCISPSFAITVMFKTFIFPTLIFITTFLYSFFEQCYYIL